MQDPVGGDAPVCEGNRGCWANLQKKGQDAGGDDDGDGDGDDDYLRVSYQQQQCDIVGSRWQPSRWAKIKVIQIQKQIQIGTQI